MKGTYTTIARRIVVLSAIVALTLLSAPAGAQTAVPTDIADKITQAETLLTQLTDGTGDETTADQLETLVGEILTSANAATDLALQDSIIQSLYSSIASTPDQIDMLFSFIEPATANSMADLGSTVADRTQDPILIASADNASQLAATLQPTGQPEAETLTTEQQPPETLTVQGPAAGIPAWMQGVGAAVDQVTNQIDNNDDQGEASPTG